MFLQLQGVFSIFTKISEALMKVLQRVLLIILVSFALVILVGYFLPANVQVKREKIIYANQDQIFEQINCFDNWENWSPWQLKANPKSTTTETRCGNGATLSWDSDASYSSNGRLSIIGSFDNDSILVLMDFKQSGFSSSRFIIQPIGKNSRIIWIIESKIGKNPFSRWFGLFSDKLIGPDLEKGLEKLNAYLLKSKNKNLYAPKLVKTNKQVIISITDSGMVNNFSSSVEKMFEQLSNFLKFKKIPPAGSPIVIFHNFTTQNYRVEAAIPITKQVSTYNNLVCRTIDSGLTIRVEHYGNYKYSSNAYAALYKEIERTHLTIVGPPWEEYVNNPENESDTLIWQTNIYMPVK